MLQEPAATEPTPDLSPAPMPRTKIPETAGRAPQQRLLEPRREVPTPLREKSAPTWRNIESLGTADVIPVQRRPSQHGVAANARKSGHGLSGAKPLPPPRPGLYQPRSKPGPAPEPVPLPQAAAEDPPDELAALLQAARPDELDSLRSAVSEDAPIPREEAEEAEFTVSEVHRLFRQLSRCWQTIPGLAPSERHIVVLKVAIGPDRRVSSITVADPNKRPGYRAAVERAVAALRHPFCEQLDVPPGKANLWRSLTLRFDPHRMQ